MKVALVHDMLNRLGGAERVLAVLAELFPKAPIYTILYDEKKVGAVFPCERVITSSLQKLPAILRRNQKYLLPFMPRAVEEWDFSAFDLVISSNTAFAHGIITKPTTHHLCYFHSPARFLWDYTHEYLKENHVKGIKKMVVTHLLKKIRMWDQASADRVDSFVANSQHVAKRIRKYYRKTANVIYPPVDTEHFAPPIRQTPESESKSNEHYFLIVSTLAPYKRIDLAVQLFNKIRRPLVIIGDGPHKKYLENIAGDTIQFLGFQPDATVKEYLKNCRALIFPGEEDFGITPIEAMASGKPILGFGKGGILETVIPGETGEFFYEPTVGSMENAIARLMKSDYNPKTCRVQAGQFSKERFITEIKDLIKVIQKTS